MRHTSAYVSIRQHTSAYVAEAKREKTFRYEAYVRIRQHTSAYVSIRSGGEEGEDLDFAGMPVANDSRLVHVAVHHSRMRGRHTRIGLQYHLALLAFVSAMPCFSVQPICLYRPATQCVCVCECVCSHM
jgi:hypothetical protein